jgi:UDP-GlcNAc:undecaprenyl-phosphate/decaprenyl-phosphate GlcNAc-1-phosphate transferase
MPFSLADLILALPAFIVSLIACRVLIAIAPKDAPDGVRKFQVAPVPSAGGVGIFFGAFVTLIFAAGFLTRQPSTLLRDAIDSGLLPHLILVAGCFGLGLADDVLHLPARAKLLILAALCFFAVTAGYRAEAITVPLMGTFVLPPLIAIIGSALWLIVMINAVNFMDGVNGLAMGASAIMLLALSALIDFTSMPAFGLEPYVRLALILFAAAIGGFLVWNLRGKIYAGDTGALGIGALIGSASLFWLSQPFTASASPNGAIWIPALIALPFLADVLMTLIWRWRRGENVLNAHRDHAYQQFIKEGWSALRVSAHWWMFSAASCVVAVASKPQDDPDGGSVEFAICLSAAIGLWLAQRRWAKRRAKRIEEALSRIGEPPQ